MHRSEYRTRTTLWVCNSHLRLTSVSRALSVLVACAPLFLFAACTNTASSEPVAAQRALQSTVTPAGGPSEAGLRQMDSGNHAKLQALWEQRMLEPDSEHNDAEFALGPGDLLIISAPQIPQLKRFTVRVSEDDSISLPLLGTISITGMTQQDLLADLSQRLRKYVYHPQVDIFLKRSENRTVAVWGAVKAPGRYMITSRSDSLIKMIERAGGITPNAAAQVILIPSAQAGRDRLSNNQDGAGGSLTRVSVGEASIERDPISNDAVNEVILNTTLPQDQKYLRLLVRPGDVILVPKAGQVAVQGWVEKPGAFPITPGLTVLGSVAAAGGALFSSSATLLRQQSDGRTVEIPLDLSAIKSGEEPDPPVQGGDVIVVNRSLVGLLPYSLYFILQRTGTGIGYYP